MLVKGVWRALSAALLDGIGGCGLEGVSVSDITSWRQTKTQCRVRGSCGITHLWNFPTHFSTYVLKRLHSLGLAIDEDEKMMRDVSNHRQRFN